MKICYLAHAGSIHTQRWIRYFADKGHEVYLISSAKPSINITKNVKLIMPKRFGPHIPIIYPLINLVPAIIQIKRLIKNINPDILHAHYIADNALLGVISKFHPFVVSAWGSDVLMAPKESKINKYLVKYVLKHADLITSDSENLRDTIISSYGINPDKNYIIFHGVDLKSFNPTVDPSQIINEYDLSNCNTVISTRSFEEVYNIDVLIQSIPPILKSEPTTKFMLKNAYGTKEPELKKMAIRLNVSKSIIFINKIINHGEMPQYLNAADIFISIPSSDSTSVSLLEAMACGLPVIVSDLPANREWVKDGWNGYIVPVRDEKALANAIVKLLNDEKKRKLFGIRNYELIKEKADYEKNMRRMEKLYESLLRRFL